MKTQAQIDENALLQKENERILNEKFAETRQLMQENAERMKELQKTVGGWSNNHGSFAEEYFYNSFENGKRNFFGENFDKISKHVSGDEDGFEDEYDIVLRNGKSICIIEVKYKAHDKDISKYLKKAETFRINFPKYKNHKVYLGLASMCFYPLLEEQCREHGIAIIKQVGDKVVIYDEHLKVY
jgi:hypothetical protein